jgi:hypothetical protein
MGDATTHAPVEPALQMLVTPQGLSPMLRSTQDAACLFCESAHRGVWCNVRTACRLVSQVAYCASSNARHSAQQVPRLRISVKYFRNFPDSSGQLRRGSGQNSGDFGKSPLRRRRDSFRYHRQKFARGHSYQRQEVLRRLILTLRFGRQLAQVLHHGVGINLANGADLTLVLAFELILTFPKDAAEEVLTFSFAQNAPEKVFPLLFSFPEDAPEKIFSFAKQASEKIFSFQFVFRLVFKFIFEFGF